MGVISCVLACLLLLVLRGHGRRVRVAWAGLMVQIIVACAPLAGEGAAEERDGLWSWVREMRRDGSRAGAIARRSWEDEGCLRSGRADEGRYRRWTGGR